MIADSVKQEIEKKRFVLFFIFLFCYSFFYVVGFFALFYFFELFLSSLFSSLSRFFLLTKNHKPKNVDNW